jgi:hypothetical protein
MFQRLIPTDEQSGFVDAHRGDGKRFIVRADEKRTAFVELESVIRAWRLLPSPIDGFKG